MNNEQKCINKVDILNILLLSHNLDRKGLKDKMNFKNNILIIIMRMMTIAVSRILDWVR